MGRGRPAGLTCDPTTSDLGPSTPETHPTVENLSSSFHFETVISSMSKDSVIWYDSKMTCYFPVKLLLFQMTESILTLAFQMPSWNKTNCKWRQHNASISHLKMTGNFQTRNEMQMTGSWLSDASRLVKNINKNLWENQTILKNTYMSPFLSFSPQVFSSSSLIGKHMWHT